MESNHVGLIRQSRHSSALISKTVPISTVALGMREGANPREKPTSQSPSGVSLGRDQTVRYSIRFGVSIPHRGRTSRPRKAVKVHPLLPDHPARYPSGRCAGLCVLWSVSALPFRRARSARPLPGFPSLPGLFLCPQTFVSWLGSAGYSYRIGKGFICITP